MAIYMALFYPGRLLSMHVGHWPTPPKQTFTYPGFPSLFVPYAKTNDYYYSGHTGLCIILLMMMILHIQKRTSIFFGCIVLSATLYMLTVTRAHYVNDIFIGAVAALTVIKFGYYIRFTVHYISILSYCKLFTPCKQHKINIKHFINNAIKFYAKNKKLNVKNMKYEKIDKDIEN